MMDDGDPANIVDIKKPVLTVLKNGGGGGMPLPLNLPPGWMQTIPNIPFYKPNFKYL